MDDLASLVCAGVDWPTLAGFWGPRAIREEFCAFIAGRLAPQLASAPTRVSLGVEHAWNHHVRLAGTVERGAERDRVAGEVVWLPRLGAFRGHVLLNPATAEELLAQDMAEYRAHEWRLEPWHPGGKPERTHDHCALCWRELYETDDPEHGSGYTDGAHWLCRRCYAEHIAPAV